MKRLLVVLLLMVFLVGCEVITPTPVPTCPPCPTCVSTPTPTVISTSTPIVTGTATPTSTPTSTTTPVIAPTHTPTSTPTLHACVAYQENCIPVGQQCPTGKEPDKQGQCGIGFLCCKVSVETPTATPTPKKTFVPSVTPTSGPEEISSAPPGGYGQYDWVCPYPLENARLPDGRMMMLCPNGLDNSKNPPVYKDDNAFRDGAGLNWSKLNEAFPKRDAVELGGIHWVSWEQIEPRENEYHWDEIDKIIAAAQDQVMESEGAHVKPKGIIIRLYDSSSERPSTRPPVSGIDGGFIFRDHTPSWLKGQMRDTIPWGGPLKNGVQVNEDDGSYWVKLPCVYPDYVESRPQGSDWSYSIWVVPKYNRTEWKVAATKMLQSVAAHYRGSGVVFILGMAGLDGEWGNYLPDYYAGCGNLRAAFGNQYKISPNNMLFQEQAKVWNAVSKDLVYSSCTAWCDQRWFDGLTGIYQARAVPDGPDYHRTGDIGVLDWALRFKDVGWENAFWSANSEYLYRMLSVVSISWPSWFSFVGGSWDADRAVLRQFTGTFGETITTTNVVWWRAFWSCYAYPDTIDCPDDAVDEGDWSSYSGWLKNLERGITTTSSFTLVNPWTELTSEERVGVSWHMLKRVPAGAYIFMIDSRWPSADILHVTIKYLGKGEGRLGIIADGITQWFDREKGYREVVVDITRVGSIVLLMSGDDLFLHGVEVSR